MFDSLIRFLDRLNIFILLYCIYVLYNIVLCF
jgi:hypothetical protein